VSSVRLWLEARRSEMPAALRPWVQAGPDEGDVVDALTHAALASLDAALALPPRSRRAAFRLLAADALLTYACEAAADEPDARGRLEGILARLGRWSG
jgi:hypothetical protein